MAESQTVEQSAAAPSDPVQSPDSGSQQTVNEGAPQPSSAAAQPPDSGEQQAVLQHENPASRQGEADEISGKRRNTEAGGGDEEGASRGTAELITASNEDAVMQTEDAVAAVVDTAMQSPEAVAADTDTDMQTPVAAATVATHVC